MAYVPYPKWLHFDGEPSVLVKDEAEHEAVMAARAPAEDEAPKPKAKPGSKPKAKEGAPEPGSDEAFAKSQENAPVVEPEAASDAKP